MLCSLALLPALLGCVRTPPTPLTPALRPGAPGTSTPGPGAAAPSVTVQGAAALRPASPPPPAGAPLALLVAVARRQARLTTLAGWLDQQVSVGDAPPLLLRLRFCWARPDRLRYEWLDPVRQLLVTDGVTLWLRPADGDWSARPLASMLPRERAALGLVPGQGFDPLGPLPVDAYRFGWGPADGQGQLIELRPAPGAPPALPAIDALVDPVRELLLELRYHRDGSGGALAGVVRYSEHRPVADGLLVPRRVTTRWEGGGPLILVDSRYRSLQGNLPLAPERFIVRPASPH